MARKITPEGDRRTDPTGTDGDRDNQSGRWRDPPVRPTRAPHGEVLWWTRSAPEDSEPDLWAAVQRVQARRLQLGMSVTELARRLSGRGWPVRRETLSRVLNGKQPTTWETCDRMADVLGVDLSQPPPDDDPS